MEAVVTHKILLGDAGFAEIKMATIVLMPFCIRWKRSYSRKKEKSDQKLKQTKVFWREFLRLSENHEICQKAINTLNAHGSGWTLTMLFELLEKLHRQALKLDDDPR